ncbi:hypothetical protein GCM10022384_02730 [Streptomyces marokkonensis]|uniref:OmpR/PhoB-type domain-containing protein n=1 Tax=Streptomyces marokkonensis TaxID=324855 RepID=A0ABP7NS18_9ACTN
MDIALLGVLAVRENGLSITPTAPKPRKVLALLVLHADRVVPVSVLTEELWAGAPPRSSRTTLQTYILQIRDLIAKALKRGGKQGTARGTERRTPKDVLVTSPGGYMLNTGEGSHDVREFDRLVGAGYRAMDAEDYGKAAQQLRTGLDLWSGSALTDVQAGSQLRTEIRRLEESRLCAIDQRIEADLRLGRHRELLPELTMLASRHPTHENLHAQLMTALHGSGRRGEALETYQRLRGILVRELGLEPSARLRGLQHSILMAGPEEPVPQGDPGVRLAPTS